MGIVYWYRCDHCGAESKTRMREVKGKIFCEPQECQKAACKHAEAVVWMSKQGDQRKGGA